MWLILKFKAPHFRHERVALPRPPLRKARLVYFTSSHLPYYAHSQFIPFTVSMVRGVEGNEMSTPRPSQKKQPPSSSQSAKNQKSILGFFQKKSTNSPSPVPSRPTPAKQAPAPTLSKQSFSRPPPSLTPVPSSDAPEPSSPIRQHEEETPAAGRNKENGLPPRILTPGLKTDRIASEVAGVALSSPSRKVCKFIAPRRISS